MNPLWYKGLFIWAVALSPYSHEEPPVLVYKSHAWFQTKACRGSPFCTVVGFYDGGNKIYVRDELGPLKQEEIIFHEMIHYLQEKSGKFEANCLNRAKREMEAYRLTKEYTDSMEIETYTVQPKGLEKLCEVKIRFH